MTSETYVECLVTTKPSVLMKFLKTLFIMLTVVFMFLGLLGIFVAFIIGLVCAAVSYFVAMQTNIEYEYLYLDKEITVDKIMGQSRRKRVATYEVERIEILAPLNSWHLDNYKNREGKVTDFSSKILKQPETRYLFFYDGSSKVIIEPSEEFVKAIYNVAPRKVFTD